MVIMYVAFILVYVGYAQMFGMLTSVHAQRVMQAKYAIIQLT
jgi:hypothetical protein